MYRGFRLRLDHRLVRRTVATDFIEDDAPEGLSEELLQAYERTDFTDVRSRLLKLIPNTDGGLRARMRAFHDSPYRGDAADGLVTYLTENDESFEHPRKSPQGRRGKFCSVVQSAASGKSRTLIEIGTRGVFVLYMNLRSRHDLVGYPFRDEFPSRILANFVEYSKAQYEARCVHFLSAILVAFISELQSILERTAGDTSMAVKVWQEQMCGTDWLSRIKFFEQARVEYDKFQQGTMTWQETTPWALLSSLSGKFPEIFTHTHFPKLVIAFDNAEELNRRSSLNYYRSDVLCSVISDCNIWCRPGSIWVVFASREPIIADYNIGYTPHFGSSARKAIPGRDLYPPFTLLDWDQFALPLDLQAPGDVGKLDHLVSFGRPIWKIILDESNAYSDLFDRAVAYFVGGTNSFDPGDYKQALASLFQRFCLQTPFAHPLAAQLIDTAISKHLCVCLGRSDNGVMTRATYPSEPFLSHVVATITYNTKQPNSLLTILRTLLEAISSGTVSTEPDGSLITRILWLLCFDFASIDRPLTAAYSDDFRSMEIAFCRMHPLTAILETMFGPDFWPSGDTGEDAKNTLKHAYLAASHWIRMDDGEDEDEPDMVDQPSNKQDTAALSQWLWNRSAVLQCNRHQAPIKQVMPIYLTDPGADGDVPVKPLAVTQNRMSQLLMSTRLHSDHAPSSVLLGAITRERFGAAGVLPYVAILMDLGRPDPAVHASFEHRIDGPCLTIHVSGFSKQIFPFLSRYAGLEESLCDILTHHMSPQGAVAVMCDVYNGTLFGRTVEPCHMIWERQNEESEHI